jgi:hypothetical protein
MTTVDACACRVIILLPSALTRLTNADALEPTEASDLLG